MATPTQLNDRDDAHQLLWDFVYGLLDEIDATELRRRISSDPDVARMYIETKMQVALVAEAARFQHPPIRLADSAEPGDSSLADEPTPLAPIGLRRRQSRTSSELSTASKWRWLNVVICAATILLVLGVGFFYLRPASLIRMRAVENHQKQLRQDHIYSYVIQPERLHPGIDNKITVQTVSMNENPQAAEIEYRLLDDNKKPQFQLVGKTDKHGRLHLEVPGGAVARGSEFELVTKQRYGATTIRGPINVDATGESVYLSIDRPVYRQGDVLRFRGVVLSRVGLRVRRQKGIEFDIRDAKGRFIPRSLHAGVTRRGVGYGEFVLPRELPVGRYELCARSASQEFQEQRQAFYVRKRNKDRLQKQLEFTRRNYSPGDPVVADFSVHQSNGRPLKNAPLDVRVRVDGTVVHRESHVSDSYGTCQIRFSLPEDIKAGSADLSVEIEQPSFREQLIRSIPIRLQRVRLEFFPEGGELVAGIPSRVYFRATDSLGRPIQVSGELLDAKGKIQAIFESAHQGRGRFGLTPAVAADSRPYTIRLTGTSATLVAEVPDVSSQSFLVVTANPGIAEPMRPLELTIRSSRKKAAIGISASCRGVTVGQTTVAINQTPKEANGASYVTETVRVPLADEASGIVRVTLFDYSVSPPLPVAERLVFRRPQKKLITKIFRPSAFLPTRRAQIDLQITDEQRRPVESAVLGVTVVDRAVWRQGRQRPQDIASHFLLHNELNSRLDLATEVKYLAHSASSNENLDLLLGTKGWRRFVHDPTPEDLLASSIQRENRTSAPWTAFRAIAKATSNKLVGSSPWPQLGCCYWS